MRAGRWCTLVLMVVASACSGTTGGPQPDSVPTIVLKLAPAGWALAEDTSGQVPRVTTGEIRGLSTAGRGAGESSLWARETLSSRGATRMVPCSTRS